MGVDTSIYNNLLRPPKSVAEYDAEAMQGQTNRLAMQMNQAKMADYQRGVQDESRLADVYRQAVGADGKTDRNKLFTGAAQAGLGAKLPGMQKTYADADKAEADIGKVKAETRYKEIETGIKKMDAAGKVMGFVHANPTLENAMSALDALQRDGIYGPEDVAMLRQQITADPSKIKALAEQGFRAAIDAKDQLSKIDTRNLGGTTQTMAVDPVTGKTTVLNSAKNTQTPDSVASNARMAREGDLNRQQSERASLRSDNRARDFNAARSEEVKAKTAIGKAPTEFQGKSAAFGARADQADKIITSLEGKYRPGAIATKQALGKAWVIGGALEAGGNMLIGENEQKAEQAQRDFINAVLRQESGAAIGESEFENAKRQYFPATGDSEGTRKQKAENRRLAVKGFKSNAGRAQFDTDAAAPTVNALPAGWSVEAN